MLPVYKMKRFSSPLLAAFILLSPSITFANDPELMNLYRRALEEMKRPLKQDDFRPVGLKTARDYDDLAQMCIEAGDYDRALELTTKALELDAFDPIANLNAGLIYYNQGDYGQAVYYLRWALRIKEKLHRTRGLRMGEELMSTAEPPARMAITFLLKEAEERARAETLPDKAEAESLRIAPDEETAEVP